MRKSVVMTTFKARANYISSDMVKRLLAARRDEVRTGPDHAVKSLLYKDEVKEILDLYKKHTP